MKKTPLIEGSLYLSLIRSIRYVAKRALAPLFISYNNYQIRRFLSVKKEQ
ncbi:hypothetical protein KM917_06800 [Virgibacillus pantothenticus]|nr:hypothetical protein [Virgibacillus pantothenticus]MBU8599711.1 hypothetical protein [Virgibacillus pantothenticus]MBU8634158.1 hypothetical protein [Virgibacillus pantothenticus]MBU8642199.1 hypothetical protein [Virgibacillus pantothenticus]MBU8645818.1 hypothetical protein [Virgibacillus pantothenticus]MBU8659364.1 hypothetical protein [Virgibacillus pantothenticus]